MIISYRWLNIFEFHIVESTICMYIITKKKRMWFNLILKLCVLIIFFTGFWMKKFIPICRQINIQQNTYILFVFFEILNNELNAQKLLSGSGKWCRGLFQLSKSTQSHRVFSYSWLLSTDKWRRKENLLRFQSRRSNTITKIPKKKKKSVTEYATGQRNTFHFVFDRNKIKKKTLRIKTV